MAIQKEKFIQLFLDEFRENLLEAENRAITLKNDPGNPDALATALRVLHSMKGSARMLQFTSIEKLVHGLESIFKGVKEGRCSLNESLLSFFFAAIDYLRASAQSVQDGKGDSLPGMDAYVQACVKLAADEAVLLSGLPPAPAAIAPAAIAPPPMTTEPPPAAAPAAESGSTDQVSPSHAAQPEPNPKAPGDFLVTEGELARARISLQAAPKENSPARLSSIRVDSGVIDQSIQLVNTLSVRQLRLRSAMEELERIDREIALTLSGGEDPRLLRRRFSDLQRKIRLYRNQYAEHLFEIELGTQELRDSVIGMRMVPLSSILNRFPRMVEEMAGSLGKKALLSIEGAQHSLDRDVIHRIQDPLIHLLRNAIDHGIESPEERRAAGKPEAGSISISCHAAGNRLTVSVQDDGRGLDYDAIRLRARAAWPENASEIDSLPEEELSRFLFRPGFSTKAEASELSGRGIGLDIVKANIEAVKGQILLDSIPGAGTRFRLVMPTTTSAVDGMFVASGGQTFFIPASAILRTLLVKREDCFRAMNRDMFTVEGANIPLSSLSLALGLPPEAPNTPFLSVLLVRRGPAETIGLSLERILGYDSLVYQSLPPNLSSLPMIQGVVFDENYRIIPILNIWAALDGLKSRRAMDSHKRFAAETGSEKPRVLVVDDSTATREIEITMLELEGWSAVGAVDGLDALDKIRNGNFDLVVSDIDMPRMDGFKLLENLRRDPDLAALPVIFVTTWSSQEAQERAKELGVDRYIFKSSFDQDNLVRSARELLELRRAGSGSAAKAPAELRP